MIFFQNSIEENRITVDLFHSSIKDSHLLLIFGKNKDQLPFLDILVIEKVNILKIYTTGSKLSLLLLMRSLKKFRSFRNENHETKLFHSIPYHRSTKNFRDLYKGQCITVYESTQTLPPTLLLNNPKDKLRIFKMSTIY